VIVTAAVLGVTAGAVYMPVPALMEPQLVTPVAQVSDQVTPDTDPAFWMLSVNVIEKRIGTVVFDEVAGVTETLTFEVMTTAAEEVLLGSALDVAWTVMLDGAGGTTGGAV
jgi:hypothetical protein